MAEPTRWGILGTGSIAAKFAEGLRTAKDAELVAVGSRAEATAETFADRFDVPRRHASYEALADDADVDAVYVATPHPMHKDNSRLCLAAGKAVLCEKPFTVNLAEARELVAFARQRKVFLMEAMWTRFFPLMGRLRELLAEGAIGDVRMVAADFGFRSGWRPEGRLLNPELAGGGLLDVGVYCVSFASMVMGPARRVAGLAHIGTTGVDEQAGFVLGGDDGRLAVLYSAARTATPQEATVMGTEGRIRIHSQFWKPDRMTLATAKGEEVIEMPFEGNGYNYEAEEVGRCLREGRTDSDVMPLDESLSVMTTLDDIRAQWGLKYPSER